MGRILENFYASHNFLTFDKIFFNMSKQVALSNEIIFSSKFNYKVENGFLLKLFHVPPVDLKKVSIKLKFSHADSGFIILLKTFHP